MVASEKMYWYTGAYTATALFELTLFYSLAVMALLYAMDRYSVDTDGRLVLAAGIFALVTEGIITPVVYEDGPLPVIFLYFLGWHGLISVVFVWHTVHRWSLLGHRRRLALWSGVLGVAWGVWSTNYWRAETIAEQAAENAEGESWDVGQWAVPKFTLFAFGFTALLIGCHWLLGFVWPQRWNPSRGWTIATGVALVAWLALWTVALPYAPLKFLAFAGSLVWLLHRSRPPADSATLLARNSGRVPLVNLSPLVCLPSGAVASYALMTGLDVDDEVLGSIYWILVGATVSGGTLAAVWAGATTWRRKPEGSPAKRESFGSGHRVHE